MLDATAHILARGEELNTNRIAEVAGVSIGSLYQYFPSKEALVAGLVERMLEDDRAWVLAWLDDGPLGPQVDTLVAGICERQADQAPVMAALLPLLPVVERDAVARQTFAELAEWLRARLADEPGLRPELADPERLEQAVFVVSRSLRWVVNEAAMTHPDWLREPAFQAEAARIVRSLWAGPVGTPTA